MVLCVWASISYCSDVLATRNIKGIDSQYLYFLIIICLKFSSGSLGRQGVQSLQIVETLHFLSSTISLPGNYLSPFYKAGLSHRFLFWASPDCSLMRF